MKNRLTKGILALMMTLVLFTGVSFASTSLEDGQYTITVKAVNATTGEPSMANDSITNPVKVNVEGGKIFITMEMADSMYDLAVEKADGSFQLAEELSENTAAKTITYRFPVESINEPVLMETVVAAMGRKVNFKLNFDQTSLVNIPPQGSAASTTTTTGTNSTTTSTSTNTNTTVPNPKTGDNVMANLMNLILVGFLMTGATYGIYHIKVKKATNN